MTNSKVISSPTKAKNAVSTKNEHPSIKIDAMGVPVKVTVDTNSTAASQSASSVNHDLTAHTDIDVAKQAVSRAIEGLSDEDRTKAQQAFGQTMIDNTDAADAAEVEEQIAALAANDAQVEVTYSSPERWEFTVSEDDSAIKAMTRKTYVWYFNVHQRRTAIAALQMCRVVYEAKKTLKDYDFDEFCKNIGYQADSSTVRKFLVIGKVYPRLVQYADQLPASWTNIYALTQMPADDFERCIAEGYRLCDLSTGEIEQLVKKTRKINNLMSPFKLDKKEMGYCVAKVYFTKTMDDTDLRLLQKAFDEIASRLPIKLSIDKQVQDMHQKRALQRYESLKQESPDAAIKPESWDYGTAANNVFAKDVA